MNSSIEPRLLAMLQHELLEPQTSTSLELPPLQDPNLVSTSRRQLLLEPHARPHLVSKHSHLLPPIDDQEKAYKSNEAKQKYGDNSTDRALGGSSPQSLRMILDDDSENTPPGGSSKKRQNEPSKDDFVQLPQPPKKQKTAVLPPSVPPMINGIHELPPKAAMSPMLPPIASSSFHDSHFRNSLNTIPPKALVLDVNTGNPSSQNIPRNGADEEDEPDQPSVPLQHISRSEANELSLPNDIFEEIARNQLDQPSELPKNAARNDQFGFDEPHHLNIPQLPEVRKVKKRNTNRRRRPWSKDETDALLLGVDKHGVGCWTDILNDPNFSSAFICRTPAGTDRTAADLKDRFRTCCPLEFRNHPSSRSPPLDPVRKEKSKTSSSYENILDFDEEARIPDLPTRELDSHEMRKQRRRAHRSHLYDLAELGIKAPFAQSSRRERKHFTNEEDMAIFEGWRDLGAQWAVILRDPRFASETRTPTDLRDRFRNKYRGLFEQQQKAKADEDQQEAEIQSSDPQSKDELTICYSSSSSLYLQGQEAESRSNETPATMKESQISSAPQLPTLQSSSSREGLRIQQIISSEQELSNSVPLQQQTPISSSKYGCNPYADPQSMDGLPFTQSQDWDSSIAAPFINEMNISRLLLNEVTPWQNDLGESGVNGMQSMGGKEKQSFTDINSILSSDTEPPMEGLPSFLRLLKHYSRTGGMNDTTF